MSENNELNKVNNKKPKQIDTDIANGWKICRNPNCLHKGEKISLDNFSFHSFHKYFLPLCKICYKESRKTWKKKRVFKIFEKDNKLWKQCSNPECLRIKEITEFHSHKGKKDNIEARCKTCANKQYRQYCKDNPEWKSRTNKRTHKKHYDKHKERLSAEKKEYYYSEKGLIQRKRWRAKDKIRRENDESYRNILREKQTLYRSNPENKKRRNMLETERRKNDTNYRLLVNLRGLMIGAITRDSKINRKHSRTTQLLGISIDKYKLYLESCWLGNMSWDNWGNKFNCWSIDHIICLELFDLSLESHQKAAFNYSNTQPLWHVDNIKKQDRLDDNRLARNLSRQEKNLYLQTHGFSYLFD